MHLYLGARFNDEDFNLMNLLISKAIYIGYLVSKQLFEKI